MNILIYMPILSKRLGGIYQYTIALLETLKDDKKNNYFVLCDNSNIELMKTIESFKYFKIIQFDVNKLFYFGNRINRLKRKLNQLFPVLQLSEKGYLIQLLKKYKIDIVHCPYQRYEDTGLIPFITTIHDVQELHFPEYFTAEERAFRAIHYKLAIEKSKKVIVSYAHVKNDILKYFNVPENKIEIVLLHMKNLWIEKISQSQLIVKSKLTSFDQFILYPAATWPHKNHKFLFNAISELAKKGIIIQAVCTGNMTEHYSYLIKLIHDLGIENQIEFKGIVSELELFSLYNYAIGVVIPTKYEAGSFPLYESIILNKPVICSNVTSLPETLKNNDYIFEPDNIEVFKERLIQLCFNEEYKNKCKQHLRLLSNEIKNENCLKDLMNIYDSCKNN